ncbi:polysaccharide deacetylase family protein [Alicyclobacillus mali]|uniref:Polysaccharide deacetylase family protein n=1 Tax=Alicyclobacillus mali (ex Roth et al. 2021) TaxID=1123961 RepID=A0ABS0F1N8_9BACL|nr:polysaccharide deacetylase family protein [Alicyclobacillus mali (ex Roth et al. 2021)]MBF8377192.1 polysaccharide deacetylase family protein [Alicyclobacillus mali (ex Roth et al. 2021)]MCL6488763.1 polysaccharide deacetylase family protein [Alicyclobacillus mali (ex Roth et al. 2021)]
MKSKQMALALCATACSWMFDAGRFLRADTSPRPASVLSARVWEEASRAWANPPVDARRDRVWHNIPGLSGFALDTAASERETTRAHDGAVHLVWRTVPPKVRLCDLPADVIYRGPSTEKSVALMVNVSWGEAYVPKMLQILRDAHVKATFFIDGAWASKFPDLVRAIARDGHAVESHGYGHPDFRRLGEAKLRAQIDETNRVLAEITGKAPRLIAPPAGSYDARLAPLAKSRGMYAILWTADTVDWKNPPPAAILERVQRNVTPGALVLMHPTASTVEALPAMIRWLEARGYRMKTVEDVIDERPAAMPPVTLARETIRS